MPEGHSIRYLANRINRDFSGKQVTAASPQGRFENVAMLNNATLTEATAHGKHLFLHFNHEAIVHIHLGLYGWIRFGANDSTNPPTENVRMRLGAYDMVLDLSGPTVCKIIDGDELFEITEKLGPDPQHPSANSMAAYEKIRKSKKSIASLLMDQSVIAGIGNVYRAEILFLMSQHPYSPGTSIDEDTFNAMWLLSKRLLERGSITGNIRTVPGEYLTESEMEAVTAHCAQTSFVYKRTGQPCRICGHAIEQDTIDNRTLYWCPRCQ